MGWHAIWELDALAKAGMTPSEVIVASTRLAAETLKLEQLGTIGYAEALRLQPDIVLCDLQLPILDGYEVLSAIRKDPTRGDTMVIAVTAFSMSGDRAKVTAAGFDGYISKPIDPTTFVQQIESLMRPDLRASRPVPDS